jgi:hypothetical protein
MTAVANPYFQKAIEFAEMAEKAKDTQSRVNYTILADCYRCLSRHVSPASSASSGATEMAKK